jgi:hypothetical protein
MIGQQKNFPKEDSYFLYSRFSTVFES